MDLVSSWHDGGFRNYTYKDVKPPTLLQCVKLFSALFWRRKGVRPTPPKRGSTERDVIPVMKLTPEDIMSAPDMSLWKLSHSAVLMKLRRGRLILTDPALSERASPFQCFGPKRFSRLPIDLETFKRLPKGSNGSRPIFAVVLSHDHYDHLDERSIRVLSSLSELFIVPLRLGSTLEQMGVERARVREFDWWETLTLFGGELQFICTPAHHNSGRSIFTIGKTLWCSWCIIQSVRVTPSLIKSDQEVRGSLKSYLAQSGPIFSDSKDNFRIFFSGDGGYNRGFAKIGELIGPFDLSLIENGQYNYEYVHGMHMLPSETAQANLDLRSKWMIPIHNSAFSLSSHMWWDPLECIELLSRARKFNLCTPISGERVDLNQISTGQRWWQSLVPQPARKSSCRLLKSWSTASTHESTTYLLSRD